jgi:acyl-CoA synthetase (AMP-forming)/AMP-acid ligase II
VPAGPYPSRIRRAKIRQGRSDSAEQRRIRRCFFAIARIGAVLVPLNPAYTDDELAPIFEDAEVRCALCAPSHRHRLEAIRLRSPALVTVVPVASVAALDEFCAARSDSAFDVEIEETALHAIMFTSGTTGRPKGAMLSHRSRVVNSLSGRLGYEITAQTRANVPATSNAGGLTRTAAGIL